MNVVPAVEALDYRTMSLRKQEYIGRGDEQFLRYSLIEPHRVHFAPAKHSGG